MRILTREGISLRKKIKYHKKPTTLTSYSKNVWHILKRFVGSGTFHQAYTSYCWRVSLKPAYNCFFFSKNTSSVFPNISFFKGTLFDFGNPICMWNWQNQTLCHKLILNKTQSQFHPLNTVVGINHNN